MRSREEFSRRLATVLEEKWVGGILDEVDFMVEEGGLRGCDGYNGSLSINENNGEWIYSVVVEEEDFDACCAIDNLGDVALHCLDHIHLLKTQADTLPRIEVFSVEDFRV